MASASPTALEVVDKLIEVEKARAHPADLLRWVSCVDATNGERFEFELDEPPENPDILEAWEEGEEWLNGERNWRWQRIVLDDWLNGELWIGLKGRQLGVTWLAGGFALWVGLTSPGSTVLVISTNEAEAWKVINRIWDMFQSLPPRFRFDVEVIKPTRNTRPTSDIILRHPDGRITRFTGMAATKKSGHGETAAIVILDELARQEYAGEIWKGVLPTMSGGGRMIAISTANGVSNEESGEGNFFHHLWVNGEFYGIKKRFLHWGLSPTRTKEWWNKRAMKPREKAEQYPNDPDEAFILTGDVYFDVESLAWYKANALCHPKYRCEFKKVSKASAKLHKTPEGCVRVFKEPIPSHSYALAADVATGRGADYSAAHVIDLATMEFVAELRGKIDVDLYAYQLHYLGRWYNTAVLAVEMGGGWGEPVVINLRDGKDGRPSYPKLYRHRERDRADIPEKMTYGFPMTQKTRPQVISQMETAIRDRLVPALSHDLFHECQTFVTRDTTPSPRAQDGCNDDLVMSGAIALELYRQYGKHPDAHRRGTRRSKRPEYPWLRA